MGQIGTSAHAVYALFSHFCHMGGFGDLRDPVLPTLRGVNGDFVTVYAYKDTKGHFFCTLYPCRGPGKTRAKDAT